MFERVEKVITNLMQEGVYRKYTRNDFAVPGENEKYFAKGQDIKEWFECKTDAYGNICSMDGKVVFPARKEYKRGDTGYFGNFRENFGNESDELPSVKDYPGASNK